MTAKIRSIDFNGGFGTYNKRGMSRTQMREALFPPKLPPLELTSKPVDVQPLLPQGRLAGLFVPLSVALHVAVIGGLVGSQIYEMFQQADTLADQRLGHPHGTGGGGKAAVTHHLTKQSQSYLE